MVKGGYGYNLIYALKALVKNPVIFVPDIIYFAATAVLAVLFLHINNLTVIFSSMASFGEQVRSIIESNLIVKFIVTLVFFILINILVGLGTISLRYSLAKTIIEKKKVDFRGASRHTKYYIFSVFGVKVILLLIHVIPLAVFGLIAFVYPPLLPVMIIFAAVLLIVLRFVFLFVYPALFFGRGRNPVKVIRNTAVYFKQNIKHNIVTGLLALVAVLLAGSFANSITSALSSFGILYLVIAALIINSLTNIISILWYTIFLFKNY